MTDSTFATVAVAAADQGLRMSTNWIHRNIIVPAAVVAQARQMCAGIPGGDGMFTAPLSANGAEPATHYISSGLIWPEFAEMLPLDVPATIDAEAHRIPGDAAKAAAALPDAPVEAIQALLAVVTVTDGDAFDTLDRMGLQLVGPTE